MEERLLQGSNFAVKSARVNVAFTLCSCALCLYDTCTGIILAHKLYKNADWR